jgi:hypothetical protein
MECAQKRYSFTQSAKLQSPMKKISDLFTDEEKKQLSYLGSMLHQEPTEEEAEQQRILDAVDSPEWAKLVASKDVKPQGEEAEQRGAE